MEIVSFSENMDGCLERSGGKGVEDAGGGWYFSEKRNET